MSKKRKGKRKQGGGLHNPSGGHPSDFDRPSRKSVSTRSRDLIKAKYGLAGGSSAAAPMPKGGISKKSKGGKGKAKQQGQGKAGKKAKGGAVEAAIREACEAGNLEHLLASSLLSQALSQARKSSTVRMVIELFVRHNKLGAAAAALQPGCGKLPFDEYLKSLLLAPQTAGPLLEEDAAALAIAGGAAAPSPVFARQAAFCLLEFVNEANASLEGIAGSALEAQVRSGKAAVVRISPGQKPGEIACERDALSAQCDRRGLLGGDCVGLTPLQTAAPPPPPPRPPPPPPPPPPCLWDEVWSAAHGRPYYAHRVTRETVWEKPREMEPPPRPQQQPPTPPPLTTTTTQQQPAGSSAVMVECEVAVGMPLILKPLSEQADALDTSAREYRVDKLANRVVYKRQLWALSTIAQAIHSRGKGKSVPKAAPSYELALALTARESGASAAQVETLCKARVADHTELVGSLRSTRMAGFERLNRSQLEATLAATGGTLTLVQGPPGTGKTQVAIAILLTWCAARAGPCLATSDSNIAVDNLLEGLAAAGVNVVRLGRPDAVRPELLRFCPDASENKRAGLDARSAYEAKLRAVKAAQVVCCTCVGAGASILEAVGFSGVVVDEATQATEAATLVSFCRGARQVACPTRLLLRA